MKNKVILISIDGMRPDGLKECGNEFTPGELKEATSLLDIAPTIADVMEIEPDPEWEGRSLVNK